MTRGSGVRSHVAAHVVAGGVWGPRGFRGVSKRVQLALGVSPARKPGRFSRRFETRSEAWMRVGVRDADRAPRNPFFQAKGCSGVGVRDGERRRATHFSWRRG